jgi:hypothetical protein
VHDQCITKVHNNLKVQRENKARQVSLVIHPPEYDLVKNNGKTKIQQKGVHGLLINIITFMVTAIKLGGIRKTRAYKRD